MKIFSIFSDRYNTEYFYKLHDIWAIFEIILYIIFRLEITLWYSYGREYQNFIASHRLLLQKLAAIYSWPKFTILAKRKSWKNLHRKFENQVKIVICYPPPPQTILPPPFKSWWNVYIYLGSLWRWQELERNPHDRWTVISQCLFRRPIKWHSNDQRWPLDAMIVHARNPYPTHNQHPQTLLKYHFNISITI